MWQAEVDMIRKLVEWLKDKFKPTEEPEEPDCADCPDYDDCTNPWICVATIEDY
jgi:hypothetical protein